MNGIGPQLTGSFEATQLITEYLGLAPPERRWFYSAYAEVRDLVHEFFCNFMITTRKPSIVFLNIGDVLSMDLDYDDVSRKKKEMFPDVIDYYGDYERRATSEFFDVKAVGHLHDLLAAFPNAAIVFNSDSGRGRSVDLIRDIFKKHAFAKRIIDKTPDKLDQKEAKRICKEAGEVWQENNQFWRQGTYIKAWLEKHPEISNYVIFDDLNLGTSFGTHFIRVGKGDYNPQCSDDLLSKKNIEQAVAIFHAN